MNRGALRIHVAALLLAGIAWAGCSTTDDNGDAAVDAQEGGSGGAPSDAGKGGTDAGTGGGAGVGGADASAGGSEAGVGGSEAGVGGSEAGEGGSAGEGGAIDAGTGGTAGTGGVTEAGADGSADAAIEASACSGAWTPGGVCATCLEGNCCDLLAACAAISDCIQCLNDPDPNSAACTPQNQDAAQALYACAETSCPSECVAPPLECSVPSTPPSNGACVTVAGKIACNPVTNAGCTGAGEACDLNQAADGYECYPPPNTQVLCQECSDTIGFCQGGLTCVGQCAKFCCTDGDCGAGVCDTVTQGFPGGVGICMAALPDAGP